MKTSLYFDIDPLLFHSTGVLRYSRQALKAFQELFTVQFFSSCGALEHYSASIENDIKTKIGPFIFSGELNFFQKCYMREKLQGSNKIRRELYRSMAKIENSFRNLGKVVYQTETPIIFSPFPILSPFYFHRDILKVQFVHDVMPLVLNEPISQKYQHSYRRLIEGLKSMDLVVTNSQFTKRALLEWDHDFEKTTVCVTPLPFDSHFIPTVSNSILEEFGLVQKKYLLVSSTLSPRKRVERVLHAWASLPSKQGYQLVLLGNWGYHLAYNQELMKLIKQTPNVIHIPTVREEALPSLYSAAFFSIFPSRYEGYGYPVLESMACGVFCLIVEGTSMEEIVGEALPKLRDGSVEECAKWIEWAFSSPSEIDELSTLAYTQAKKFKFESFAQVNKEALSLAFQKKYGCNLLSH